MRSIILGLVDSVGHPVRRIVADRIPTKTGPIRVGLATVTGRSMEPALHDGDQLLVVYLSLIHILTLPTSDLV